MLCCNLTLKRFVCRQDFFNRTRENIFDEFTGFLENFLAVLSAEGDVFFLQRHREVFLVLGPQPDLLQVFARVLLLYELRKLVTHQVQLNQKIFSGTELGDGRIQFEKPGPQQMRGRLVEHKSLQLIRWVHEGAFITKRNLHFADPTVLALQMNKEALEILIVEDGLRDLVKNMGNHRGGLGTERVRVILEQNCKPQTPRNKRDERLEHPAVIFTR